MPCGAGTACNMRIPLFPLSLLRGTPRTSGRRLSSRCLADPRLYENLAWKNRRKNPGTQFGISGECARITGQSERPPQTQHPKTTRQMPIREQRLHRHHRSADRGSSPIWRTGTGRWEACPTRPLSPRTVCVWYARRASFRPPGDPLKGEAVPPVRQIGSRWQSLFEGVRARSSRGFVSDTTFQSVRSLR